MSSQPKNVTTTSVKDLPTAFKDLPAQYVGLLGNTSTAAAPLTSGQQQSLASLGAAGAAGAQQLSEAQGLLRNTAQGGFVGANPYLDSQIAKAQGDVATQFREATAPTIDSASTRAGIFGGSAWSQQQGQAQKTLADSLSNVSTQMRGNAYITERAQQETAMRDLGNSADSGIKYQQSLFGAYEPERLAQQALIDENQRKLALYGQALNMGYNGASTAQTGANPNYKSPLQQAAGLGLMGAGLFTGSPVAASTGMGLM